MCRLFIAFACWLGLLSSASATMAEIPVTPASLDTGGYLFAVSTNAAGTNVIFHIQITSKNYDIYPDSGASVDVIARRHLDDGGLMVSSGAAEPAVQVHLEKGARVWKADFAVPRESLKNPDLYFVYGVIAHTTVNGKTIPMPSITSYQIKLQDFAKP
jgi:hypothetical protein